MGSPFEHISKGIGFYLDGGEWVGAYHQKMFVGALENGAADLQRLADFLEIKRPIAPAGNKRQNTRSRHVQLSELALKNLYAFYKSDYAALRELQKYGLLAKGLYKFPPSDLDSKQGASVEPKHSHENTMGSEVVGPEWWGKLPDPQVSPSTFSPRQLQGHDPKSSKALAITSPDNFIMYDWPLPVLSAYDFTICMWYKTPHQPGVTVPVVLIGNVRESREASQFGRHFVLQMLRTGHLEVAFSGYEPVAREFFEGRIESNSAYDDDLWHRVWVVRNGTAETVALFVDGAEAGRVPMPVGVDLDGQEQRVVIAGGNDRHFRTCQIDELLIWSNVQVPVPVPPSEPEECSPNDPHLVAHFTFDDDSGGVRLRDCSATRGDAIRVGSALQDASAFVEGAPLAQPCAACVGPTWSSLRNETVLLTYLGVGCGAELPNQFVPGNIHQLEAYIGAMWLDANRLGLPMIIVTECIPDSVIALYTTPAVTFVKLENLPVQLPPTCPRDTGAVIKRFFVYHHLFHQTNHFANYQYVVHIDLRDSRIVRVPKWDAQYSLWVQTVRDSGNLCGGFQAGKIEVMASLMAAFWKETSSARCQFGNDQGLLRKIVGSVGTKSNYGWRLAPNKTQHNGDMVNRQQTRIFDGSTAFVHGNWWMSKQKINDSWAKEGNAYPRAVPYYASLSPTERRKGERAQEQERLQESEGERARARVSVLENKRARRKRVREREHRLRAERIAAEKASQLQARATTTRPDLPPHRASTTMPRTMCLDARRNLAREHPHHSDVVVIPAPHYLVFVENHKAASSTVRRWLWDSFGESWGSFVPGSGPAAVGVFAAAATKRNHGCMNKGRPTTACLGLIEGSDVGKYTVFTFVRDPVSRGVSGARQIKQNYKELFPRIHAQLLAAGSNGGDSTGIANVSDRVANVARLVGGSQEQENRCLGCPQEHVVPQLWQLGVPAAWRRPREKYITPTKSRDNEPLRFDFVGRLESFDADMDALLQLLRRKNSNETYASFATKPENVRTTQPGDGEESPLPWSEDVGGGKVLAALQTVYADDIRCLGYE